MLLNVCWHVVVLGSLSAVIVSARRVRVQAVRDDQLQYYSPDDSDQQQAIVLVSSSDDYNGLYGRPSHGGVSRSGPAIASRTKEPSNKPPPVQTIRNYNKVNDDGSFTFGYEAADGSFKEETRGTDCVVRGKYGYVDPDGNKREFTYVSGNPCDPNAPQDEDKDVEDSAEQEGPANYPVRPVRPISQPVRRPAVTVFHNAYDQLEDAELEQPEPQQILTQQPIQAPRHRIIQQARPTYVPEERPQAVLPQRGRLASHTTPVSVQSTTARPSSLAAPSRGPPATTYRPQLVQLAVTPRPSLLYTHSQTPASHYNPSTAAPPLRDNILDFAAEFRKFQSQDNHISPTHAPKQSTHTQQSHPPAGGNAVYSSELVYDPTSGQYNTQLYQSLPQTDGDFTLNHRIQPYVHQPQPQLVSFRQLQQQSPLYRPLRPSASVVSATTAPQQQLYAQQQADLQFHNSQQLYAQQQKARQQQHAATTSEPQHLYYYQPTSASAAGAGRDHGGLSTGQIEAFLRGHNIQF